MKIFSSSDAAHSSTRPRFLSFRSSKWFLLSVTALAIFSEMFLYTVVVPVLPFTLGSRAGVAAADIQYWVSLLLSVYGAALFWGSLPVAWLSDRTSTRQPLYLVGLAVLAVGSLVQSLGTNLPMLVVGRVLQGLASAFVWVVGFALLADSFPSEEMGTAIGFAVLGFTTATLVGPVLGGVVYARAGYYAVFYMAFGLITLDLVFRVLMVERRVAARWLEREDKRTVSEAVHPPYAYEEKTPPAAVRAANFPETTGAPRDLQPAAPRSTTAARYPVFVLLRDYRILFALWAGFVQALTIMAFDGTLPLHVHRVFGWEASGAGLIFLALVLPSLCAPLVGRFVTSTRRGRWAAAAGFALATPALALLRFVDAGVRVGGSPPGSVGQVVLLCALLAVVGFAMTAVLVPVLADLTFVVDDTERGRPGVFGPRGAYARVYSLMNMCWASGAVVGPIVAGFIVDRAGWGTTAWVLALINGVTALLIALCGWQESRRAGPAGDGLGWIASV